MSREEEINITFLLKQMDAKQDAHIKASNEFRENMIGKISAIETNAKYSNKQLNDHSDDITSLKATRSKQNGAMWAFGIIWTAILAFLRLSK